MQTAFEKAHGDQITGTLTTVDRLIIHGHLTKFWHRRGFAEFLFRQGVRVHGFGRYAQRATEQVRKHAEKIAARLCARFGACRAVRAIGFARASAIWP